MLHPATTGERSLQTELDRHHSCDASSIPVLQRSVDSMTATRAHRAKAAHFGQQTSRDSRSGTGEVLDLLARSARRIITSTKTSQHPSQIITRLVDSSVTFRYHRLVTVVGKGGRPRKWRSDTDRVRAYRARQRGAEEPPTVDEALDGGDDAALAWNRVRELECALEDLRRETKLSKASAREARKALDHERVRFGWINEENIRLRSEIEALRAERDALQVERTTLLATKNGLSTPAVRANAPNREQRRQAERRRGRST